MYKPLHEELRRSRKHAAASAWASTVWFLVLPQTDSRGALPADPAFVKSTCFPYRRERNDQVERAMQELAKLGLIHLYVSGGERFLVVHDHQQWVKGVLLKPKYPSPPPNLCRCLRPKPKEGEDPPFPSIHGPVQEGQEKVQEKHGEELRPASIRVIAARAFKVANGGKQQIESLADHFVSLENAGAPAAFVSTEIPKKLGEAPWACCDRVREAWKRESQRRAEVVAMAVQLNEAVTETPEAPDAAERAEKLRATLRKSGIRA